MRIKVSLLLSFIFLLFSFLAKAQITPAELDELIAKTRTAFDVPGIAVGILKDGKIIYAKGNGVRSLKNSLPVNDKTLFGIASNSKGFTCIALGMLVDEKKLDWNDKVRKYIPEFTLYDPYVSEEFTILDLLTHRSGLTLGAGDLMFFPEGGSFTIKDIIHNVRYLQPESSFRSQFQYNNNMYNIAGEVLHRASGMSWEEFIENRILKPVGMSASTASYNRVKNNTNIIDAHAPVNGNAVAIPHDWNSVANPAGGIMSNVADMLTWAEFLINKGVTKDGKRLISEQQLRHIFSIQMSIPIAPQNKNYYDTKFNGYGLGYFLRDVKGYREITHTGGLIGTVTQFILIPEIKLAIVVLTNQQSGAAFNTISNTIKDSYLGIPDRNWLKTYTASTQKFNKYSDSLKNEVYAQVEKMQQSPQNFPDKKQITGVYKDNWFGNIHITAAENKLRITCENSPRLKGDLLPYNYNTYIAKWDDRSYDADAYILFRYDETGKAQDIQLKPISPITDFSFDFEDLAPKRMKD